MAITAEELAAQLRALEVEADAASARRGRKRKSASVPVEGTWQHALAEPTDDIDTALVSRANEVMEARGAVVAAGTHAPIVTTVPGAGPHRPVPPPPTDVVVVPRDSVASCDGQSMPPFQVPSAGEQQLAAGYEVIDPAELKARISVQGEHIVTLTMALDAQQSDAAFQRAQLDDALAARAQAHAALEKIARAHAAELDRTRRAAQSRLEAVERARAAAEARALEAETARREADVRIAALTSAMEAAERAAEDRIMTLTKQLGGLSAAEDVAGLRAARDTAASEAAAIRAELAEVGLQSEHDSAELEQARRMQTSLAAAHIEACEAAGAAGESALKQSTSADLLEVGAAGRVRELQAGLDAARDGGPHTRDADWPNAGAILDSRPDYLQVG